MCVVQTAWRAIGGEQKRLGVARGGSIEPPKSGGGGGGAIMSSGVEDANIFLIIEIVNFFHQIYGK